MCAMPNRLITSLLAAADPLPYPARLRLFASRARELAATGELDPVLAELATGEDFEREIGLFLAQTVGHLDAITAYAVDPDWRLRQRALRAMIRGGRMDATRIAAVVDDAPMRIRRYVIRALRTVDATGLADAIVDRVRAAFGDAEAARLLPTCGANTVARLLPELGHWLENWMALARRHPLVVVAEAQRQLAGLSDPGRADWWRGRGRDVLAAGDAQPEAVLDLLERLGPTAFLPGRIESYGVLARADGVRVLGLFTAASRAAWLAGTRLPRALLDRWSRLDPASLVMLARRLRDAEPQLIALLDAVAPSRRGELYDAAFAGVVRDQADLSRAMLDVLPRQRRIAEARRILALGRRAR
jgi:hypothetical protein